MTTLLAFWNGTPLFCRELNSKQEKEMKEYLKEDFFLCDEERIYDAVLYLNDYEEALFQKVGFNKLKPEDFDFSTSVKHLLMINSLVKRGLVKNDDKNGLLWVKDFRKRSC